MKKIKVETTRFGTIEVSRDDVYVFPRGIIGFEPLKRYVILNSNKGNSILWLQSVEDPEIAFIISNPKEFITDYELKIPPSCQLLAGLDVKRTFVFTILYIDKKKKRLYLNILAPLLIDPISKLGIQILTDTPMPTISFPLRQP